jgi:Sulfotransferase family
MASYAMISHEYRCIFIHIPRCAGTSVETWITGRDWWQVAPQTKHLIASQAKCLYGDYWNKYYKFAIARDPFDRMISSLKYAEYFGLSFNNKRGFYFDRYHELFGRTPVVEHDHRFYKRASLVRECHKPYSVYGNILDEPLDFIARFENLADDMREVQLAIGCRDQFVIHVEQSAHRTLSKNDLLDRDLAQISEMFRADLETFSYSPRGF